MPQPARNICHRFIAIRTGAFRHQRRAPRKRINPFTSDNRNISAGYIIDRVSQEAAQARIDAVVATKRRGVTTRTLHQASAPGRINCGLWRHSHAVTYLLIAYQVVHREAKRELRAESTMPASGSRLTFEFRKGFPADRTHASLAHANRNFHRSQAC